MPYPGRLVRINITLAMLMKRIFATAVPLPALHVGLLILRIGVSALMLTHGIPKLTKLLAGNFEFGDPIGLGSGISLVLAVGAEVGCSLLVLIGAGTRLAVIPLMFTMLVAAVIVHADDPFGRKELPLLYLLIYTLLSLAGSGKYSVDHLIGKPYDKPERVLR
jgi:putative oxidoreductase